MSPEPLVCVLTPVYNGVATIERCIKSVLAQSYGNWRYTIVDNCSDDGTSAIVDRYAEQDNRISVVRHTSLLPAIDNLNFTMTQVHADSRYCQVVHADDELLPACLARKVEAAENNPSAAIIASYARQNDERVHEGLPENVSFLTGREAAARSLKSELLLWRTPTTILLRSEHVRERAPFYPPGRYEGDQMACYELLTRHDLAFVHETLAVIGDDDNRITSRRLDALNPFLARHLALVVRYGPRFLDERGYAALLEDTLDRYYHFLGRGLLKCQNQDFWQFHRAALSHAKQDLSRARVLRAALARLVEQPKRSLRQLARGLHTMAFRERSAS